MLQAIGRRVLGAFDYVAALFRLLRHVLRSLAPEDARGGRVLRRTRVAQIYFTAVQAVPLAILLGAVLGFASVLAADAAQGFSDRMGSMLLSFQVLELGPMITAFIVLGRSGGAVTVELGNMVVAREPALLEALGIDLYRHIVWPRLVGVSVATGCLVVILNAACVLGGAVAALFANLTVGNYFDQILVALTPAHIFFPPLKAFVFGVFVALIACEHGLTLKPLFTEVPKASIKTFIGSVGVCLALNVVMVAAYYWWQS